MHIVVRNMQNQFDNLVAVDAAEHADHTSGVGNGAVSREDRGEDGTKSDLVFAVFNRVAGFPAFGRKKRAFPVGQPLAGHESGLYAGLQ